VKVRPCTRATQSSTSDIRPLWAALVIVLAGLVSYHNSFSVPFVFDDHLSITDNPTLSSLATAWIPPRGQGATVEGRPLLNVSLALSRALSPVNTVAFHAMNLAIHLGAGLALLGLVRRTLQAPCFAPTVRSNATVLAGFIALLWTVHPLQTESVTYIVQRAESQMGLFFLLTLYAFVRGCEGGAAAGIWFSGAIVACWLGAATKEVMVAAPILAWLHDRTFTAGSFRAAWQKRRAVYVGLFTAWILVGLLVWSSGSRGGTVGFGAQVGWWDYALTQCDAITRYLRLAVWPNPLVFDYGVEAKGSLGDVAPQALLVAGLLVGTAWALVKRPLWGFLGIWFLAMLAPTSLIPGNRQTIAERRIYLSLAAALGIGVVGTHVLLTWWNRVWAATLGVLLGTSVTLGLMALTVDRNGDYCSELALYRDTAAKRPGNAFAHYNLGNYLAEHGQPLAAITAYEAALQARPIFQPRCLISETRNLRSVGFRQRRMPSGRRSACSRTTPTPTTTWATCWSSQAAKLKPPRISRPQCNSCRIFTPPTRTSGSCCLNWDGMSRPAPPSRRFCSSAPNQPRPISAWAMSGSSPAAWLRRPPNTSARWELRRI
jgi:hypothetical protein